MFSGLIKRLFSTQPKKEENYLYFEDLRKTTKDTQNQAFESVQNSLRQQSPPIKSIEEKHQIAFYDILFGQQSKNTQDDELSEFISEKIEHLLASPLTILKDLPILPASITKIIEQLNNNEFDTDELIECIKQEPAIIVKVIELANSSFYNHSHKEITDLKSAFLLLGVNGLMEGVINGFISKLVPHSSMYFQIYGNKIWQHSLSTGLIAKQIITDSENKNEIAQGYLIGLICNLGDMIVFQLLMEAFSFVHPDCQPNTLIFKDLLYKNSKKLTYHIAKYWGLPKSILEILALQTKLKNASMLAQLINQQPLACFIYEANILSELEIRLEHSKVDNNDIIEIKNQLIFSEQAKQYLASLLNNSTK